MAYRGVLLDLFGTLVHFDARRLPELPVGDERVRTTVGALGPLLAEWVPGVTPEAFWPVLLAVSEEMVRARAELLLPPARGSRLPVTYGPRSWYIARCLSIRTGAGARGVWTGAPRRTT